MKERLKSLLLVILITNALILSLGINKFEDKKEVPLSTSFFDVIKPEKVILHLSGKILLLSYNDFNYSLYENSKELLKKAFLSEVSEEKTSFEGRFVEFSFANELNTYLLAESLGAAKSSLPEVIPKVKKIFIFFEEETPVLKMENEVGEAFISLNKNDVEKLSGFASAIENRKDLNYYYNAKKDLNLSNDLYFPYQMNKNFPTFSMKNLVKEMDGFEKRKIAESFFTKERETLQEIVEKDGSSLYICANEALTFTPSGEIKYFCPVIGKIRHSNVSKCLLSAMSFLKKRIGLDGIFLSDVKEVENEENRGYELSFDYKINGVAIRHRNFHQITVEVYQNHIRGAKIIMRREAPELFENVAEISSLLSSMTILEDNYELFKKIYEEKSGKTAKEVSEVLENVSDISLMYYDAMFKERDSSIIPIWVFKTNFGVLGFDATKGNLVLKEVGVGD